MTAWFITNGSLFWYSSRVQRKSGLILYAALTNGEKKKYQQKPIVCHFPSDLTDLSPKLAVKQHNTHHTLFSAGVTTEFFFTIYSYQICATLNASYYFKSNFWNKPYWHLKVQIFFYDLVPLNIGLSSKARDFVYIKVTHVPENEARTLSPPSVNILHQKF